MGDLGAVLWGHVVYAGEVDPSDRGHVEAHMCLLDESVHAELNDQW
jgi:hypothetical protein